MDINALMKKVLGAVASSGDIYTDAPECEASVAAAQNLAVLAQLLGNSHSTTVCDATLLADGVAVGEGRVQVDGSILWQVPADFDTSGKTWALELLDGDSVSVTMFAGETADDESWVVADASKFYEALLKLPALAA